MTEQGTNREAGQRAWGTRLFSAIGLYLGISWLISLLLYQSNRSVIVAHYSSAWLGLLGMAAVVTGVLAWFTAFIWTRSGRPGDEGEKSSPPLYQSWYFNLVAIVLVWLVMAGLIYFHGHIGERGVVNFNEQVIVIGLVFSFALITLFRLTPLRSTGFLSVLEKLLSRKWFHFALLFLLLVFFTFQGIHHGIFWQGMIGDETLDIYAARTIADGQGPFADYIILHPPLAYLPTALFIVVGRHFDLEPLIAARLGKLLLFLVSTILVYISAHKLTRSRILAFLGAALIGWNAIFTLISYNSPTKLYVLFFSLLLILLIQFEKWFWVGVSTLALVLSWGGGFLFLPLPFVVLLFGQRKGAFKRWVLTTGGLVFAVLLIVLYLNFTGALDLFYRQYILGTLELLLSKFGPTGYSYTNSDLGLLVRLRFMSGVDRFILILVAGAFLLYLHRQFDGWITLEKLRWLVSNTNEAPLVLLFAFVVVLSLADFQSFLDAIPLIVPGSLLLMLVIKPDIEALSDFSTYHDADVFLRVLLIVVTLGIARTLQPVKTSASSLEAQKTAAAVIDTLAPEATVQYLGHLGKPVLQDEKNPSRVIHLGPKTMLALEAEGLTLDDFLQEIDENQPDYIVVDTRNVNLEYLSPVFAALDEKYAFVEDPLSGLEYRKVYYLPDDPLGQTLAYSLILSGKNPALVKAEMADYQDDLKTTLAEYREAVDENWLMVNFSQLELGRLRYSQGKTEDAQSNFEFVTGIGPFRDLGSLAIGTILQSAGEEEQAQGYYTGVFGDEVPASFVYRGPDVYAPFDLLRAEGRPVNVKISDTHFLSGYQLEEVDADHSLLTLWWYVPDRRGARAAEVLIRWVDNNGNAIEAPGVYYTLFYPELGVRWSYLIDNAAVERAAGFQVGFVQEDNGPVYGETVFVRDPSGLR